MTDGKSKYFHTDLIYRFSNKMSKETLLESIANDLIKKGFVSNKFYEFVLDREKEYPTGLPGNVNIAIPHTYPEQVKKEFIAVVILDQTVEFVKMATEEETLDVSVVFILGYKNGAYQVQLLQLLIEEFINGNGGDAIKSIDNDQELVRWLIEKIESKLI